MAGSSEPGWIEAVTSQGSTERIRPVTITTTSGSAKPSASQRCSFKNLILMTLILDRFEDQGARIRRYLKENIFFDLSVAPQWGRAQLECAVKVFGPDHILYGGSYPIRRDWFQEGVGYVRALTIPDADKALILGGNARRLFKLT